MSSSFLRLSVRIHLIVEWPREKPETPKNPCEFKVEASGALEPARWRMATTTAYAVSGKPLKRH